MDGEVLLDKHGLALYEWKTWGIGVIEHLNKELSDTVKANSVLEGFGNRMYV